MSNQLQAEKSADRLAFEHYLRTGERLTSAEWKMRFERKYNHNHDELGKFTFSSGGFGVAGNSASANAPPHFHGTSAASHRSQSIATHRTASHASASDNSGNHPVRRSTAPDGGPLQREGYTRWTQVGSHPARVYRTRAGAAIIDPRSGRPMLVPKGVSIRNTIRVARMFSSPLNREVAATEALRPGGALDFQRTHSTLRRKNGEIVLDQRFVAVGNYNFGVYAAASGMSLTTALRGAAVVYARQSRNFDGNPKNESLIISGYRDYVNGNVGD